MVPSSQMDFSLQPLLEELNQNELSKFKYLLRTLSPKDELQHILQTEIEKADEKQLAKILSKHCTSYWVEMVTIRIFDKMD
ncbi:PREDICTED: pyrin domain-containing protein 2 [Hipposideros armiger]|uniref:Pyrin domain-containing protein 2 n=1 Tax=Hipposideros armiger TaxID=186990 RepID=A0A8B7Q4P1_HIPAR|nr:PREDICTED: pyrin domain-containing protein 2 [Hipposideros armiger]